MILQWFYTVNVKKRNYHAEKIRIFTAYKVRNMRRASSSLGKPFNPSVYSRGSRFTTSRNTTCGSLIRFGKQ